MLHFWLDEINTSICPIKFSSVAKRLTIMTVCGAVCRTTTLSTVVYTTTTTTTAPQLPFTTTSKVRQRSWVGINFLGKVMGSNLRPFHYAFCCYVRCLTVFVGGNALRGTNGWTKWFMRDRFIIIKRKQLNCIIVDITYPLKQKKELYNLLKIKLFIVTSYNTNDQW